VRFLQTGGSSTGRRLARDEAGVERSFTAFLARGLTVKSWADYDDGERLSADDTQRVISGPEAMLRAIAAILAAT
jgi:hypothetical protein